MVTLANCTGANSGSGNGNYINNSTTQQASSNFNISNAGIIGTTLTVGGLTTLNGNVIAKATSNTSAVLALQDNTGATALEIRTGAASASNVFIGNGSGQANTNSFNTAVGTQTLQANTSGNSNAAFGYRSLFNNTTGSTNSGFGILSLGNNTTGSNNVALGSSSLLANTTGSGNVSVGSYALQTNTVGGINTAIGYGAGLNATGTGNVFLGNNAGAQQTTGDNKLYIANSNTTTPLIQGDFSAQTLTFNSSVTTTGSESIGTTLTVGTAITNNGSTVNTVNTVSNFASNGSLAQSAVDSYTNTAIPQTTAGITVTVPAPTASTTYGRILYISNTGTASFSFSNPYLTAALNPGATATIIWANISGGRWTYAGADGNGILNQTTQQASSNFNISNAGVIGTTLTVGGLTTLNSNLVVKASSNTGSALTLQDSTGTTALEIRTGGAGNNAVLIGKNAGAANTGNNNVALGVNALQSNTTGADNVAIGLNALNGNVANIYNTAIGSSALKVNSANYNTAVGALTLQANTTGGGNVAVGFQAGSSNQTGNSNVFLGLNAGQLNVSGNSNAYVGYQAGQNALGGGNTYLGNSAGNGNNCLAASGGAGCTANLNTAVGSSAGTLLQTGSSNALVGFGAGSALTTGSNNVALGANALLSATANSSNIAIGSNALANTTGASNGTSNLAIGTSAANKNVSGNNNVSLGDNAGYNNTTSSGNISIGAYAGYSATGGGNVFIGNNAGQNETGSNKLYIANSSTASPLIQGDFSASTLVFNGAATTTGTLSVGSAAGSGALLNNGSTVNTVNTVSNFASNGSLAQSAVDNYTYTAVPQTTASIVVTVPSPTASTTYGRVVYISNTGTASFTFSNTYLTAALNPGATATIIWANVGGGKWTYAGADGNGILNQTTQQASANFNISGAGVIGTTLTVAGLTTANANLIVKASSNTTPALTLQDSAGATTLEVRTGSAAGINTFIGKGTGQSNTTGFVNTALGASAFTANTTGAYNTAVGAGALQSTTTTNYNSAFGYQALTASTGTSNSAFGSSALSANTTGYTNSAFGYNALTALTTGYQNDAFGSVALSKNQTGFNNVAVGGGSLYNNISGTTNTSIGHDSGFNSTGSGNVFIGYQAGASVTSGDNKLYIANNNTATPLIQGDFSAATAQINGAFTAQSLTNSSSAFQVNNVAGANGSASLLQVDTTSDTLNLATNGSFEQNVTPWTPKVASGSPVTLTSSAAGSLFGSKSLLVSATSANASDGAQITGLTFAAATQYLVSYYIKTTGGTLGAGGLSAGYSTNNGTSYTPMTLVYVAPVTATGWTRVTSTFTPGATATGGFYLGQTNAGTFSYYVDGVSVEPQSAGSGNYYRDGKIQLNGQISSQLTVQAATNNTSAFSVTSATGTPVLNVDTANNITGVNGALLVSGAATLSSTLAVAGAATLTSTLNVGGTATFAGGATISGFSSGTWIDLPTTGPSGIGTGGPGANALLAYVSVNGSYFSNAVTGDSVVRNSTGRVLLGATSGTSAVVISSSAITNYLPVQTSINNSASAVSTIQNTATNGYSVQNFIDSSGTLRGGVGYGNSTTSAVYANTLYLGAGAGAGTPVALITNGVQRLTVADAGAVSISSSLAVTGGVSLGAASSSTGVLTFNNASNANAVTLQTATQANAVALTIPADTNTTDTICLLTLANCGGGSGNGNYIQNTTTQQASSNFNISGAGVIGTTLTVGGLVTANANLAIKATSNTASALTIKDASGATAIEVRSGTASDNNTFIGIGSGQSNTGYFNTALGASALSTNTSGSINTAIGKNALAANQTGSFNTALGNQALGQNTSASYNTGIGNGALGISTTGVANTAVGNSALGNNGTGGFNVALGSSAGNSNTSGSNNTFVGSSAGYQATGTGNVFLGYQAGGSQTSGDNKLYVANSNTTTPLIGGDFSAATLLFNGATTNTGTLTVGGVTTLNNNLIVNGTEVTNDTLSVTGTAHRTNLTNGNTSSTADSISAEYVALTGTANSNGGNVTNGFFAGSVTPVTGNTFNAFRAGTGYDSLLNYNNTSLISGTGFIQNAAVDSTLNYSNLQKVTNLTASGSLAVQGSGGIVAGVTSSVNGKLTLNNALGGTAAILQAEGGSDVTLTGYSGAFVIGNYATQNSVSIDRLGSLTVYGSTGTSLLSATTSGTSVNVNGSLVVKTISNTASALTLKDTSGSTALEVRTGAAADANTFIGVGTGASNTAGSGTGNTALGVQALNANTTGTNNIAIGNYTLYAGTTASSSIAIGNNALQQSSGYNNVAIGGFSGSFNSSNDSTFVGFNSGLYNQGSINTAIGSGALAGNGNASANAALGYNALHSNATGYNNVAIGASALQSTTSGGYNVAIGSSAGTNATGIGNVFIGNGAGAQQTSGDNQLYIANSNTTTPLIQGDFSASTLSFNGRVTIPTKSPSATTSSLIIGDDIGVSTVGTRARVQIGNASGGSELLLGQDSTHALLFNYTYNANPALGYGTLETYGGNNKLVLQSVGGNVCIGNTTCTNKLGVTGNIAASGSITANTTPDLAEYIPAASDVAAADVVMADPSNTERVVKATNASGAVGVISDGTSSFKINPYGGVDGVNSRSDIQPLVLAGRVPVKISGENGAVKPGDYLTVSATLPGYAMKATKAGATIGKALGFFDGSGTGTVLVLVNVSYYSGSVASDDLQGSSLAVSGDATLGGNVSIAKDLNVGGVASVGSLTVTGNVRIGGDLTVVGTLSVANLVVGKHILSQSITPTVAAGAAAGANGTVTIDGTDTAGTLSITVGARAAAGTTPAETLAAGSLANVTFASPFEATPRVVISPTSASSVNAPVYLVKTATGYQVMLSTAATNGATYQFDYIIVGSAGVAAAVTP